MSDTLSPLKRRKFNKAALTHFLKSRGGSVKAIVLARMKRRSTTPGRKAPPVSLRILICSETTKIREIVPAGEAQRQYELTQGETYWYGAWDPMDNVQPGCMVVLANPSAKMFNDVMAIKGRATLLKAASYELFANEAPLSLFQVPPSLEELVERGNLILNFNGASTERPVAYTEGIFDNRQAVYSAKDREGNLLKGAYIEDYGGYPTEIVAHGGVKVLVSLKYYDNNFDCFGIVNNDAWVALAPLLMDELVAFPLTYVDREHTRQLSMNLSEASQSSNGPNYAVGLSCTKLVVNLPEMLAKAGLEVTTDYVKKQFKNLNFVENNLAERNELWKQRESGSVVNLSEYTGELSRFYDSEAGWRFYALLDYYHDRGGDGSRTTYTAEELATLRSAATSNQERVTALENRQKMHYTTLYIYACKHI